MKHKREQSLRLLSFLHKAAKPAHTEPVSWAGEGNNMLGFVLGCMTGGVIGVAAMCCFVTAGRADKD